MFTRVFEMKIEFQTGIECIFIHAHSTDVFAAQKRQKVAFFVVEWYQKNNAKTMHPSRVWAACFAYLCEM